MKSILRGSGACAGAALLSGFLLFTAKSSPAETLLFQGQQSKSQPTQTPNPEPVQPQIPVSEAQNPGLASQPQNMTVESDVTTKAATSSEVASASDKLVTLKPGEASPGKVIEASANAGAPLSAPVSYIATAYSLRGRTASGAYVTRGIIAADPRVLPLGSRVRIEAGPWSGEYLVADTGGRIKGRKIDIWTPNSREAMRFGRRSVKVTILSYGGKRKPVAKRPQI